MERKRLREERDRQTDGEEEMERRDRQTDGEEEIERRERETCRHRQTCILIIEELLMNVFGFLHSVVIVSAFVQMTNQNNTIACHFIDVKMMFLYINFD